MIFFLLTIWLLPVPISSIFFVSYTFCRWVSVQRFYGGPSLTMFFHTVYLTFFFFFSSSRTIMAKCKFSPMFLYSITCTQTNPLCDVVIHFTGYFSRCWAPSVEPSRKSHIWVFVCLNCLSVYVHILLINVCHDRYGSRSGCSYTVHQAVVLFGWRSTRVNQQPSSHMTTFTNPFH